MRDGWVEMKGVFGGVVMYRRDYALSAATVMVMPHGFSWMADGTHEGWSPSLEVAMQCAEKFDKPWAWRAADERMVMP